MLQELSILESAGLASARRRKRGSIVLHAYPILFRAGFTNPSSWQGKFPDSVR